VKKDNQSCGTHAENKTLCVVDTAKSTGNIAKAADN
jgi:hypothetical protein